MEKLKKCVTEVDSKVKNAFMHNGTKPVHTKPGYRGQQYNNQWK